MEIRFAQAKDVTGILSLLKQVGQLHHQVRPDIFRDRAQKYGASQVLSMLDSPKTPIFVAVVEEKVVGYGFCQVTTYENDPVFTDRTEVYIDDLCVDESCRGQGIGKKIYEEIIRYARMRRADRVTLNVWCGNENAEKFYASLGFVPQKMGLEITL